VWRNLVLLLVTELFALSAASFVQFRTWELVMTLEPQHGSAQLVGSVRPQVITGNCQTPMVLLPDGRLWVPTKLLTRITSYDSSEGDVVEGIPSIPVSGHFIGSSNWTHIAVDMHHGAGIQKDGSLWKITWDVNQFSQFSATNRIVGKAALNQELQQAVFNVPEISVTRLGQDSDWKSVISIGMVCWARRKGKRFKSNLRDWNWVRIGWMSSMWIMCASGLKKMELSGAGDVTV
jgi:hypothetical protein